MKLTRLIAISGVILFMAACGNRPYTLAEVNSVSFAENQMTLDGAFTQRIGSDSLTDAQEPGILMEKLDELISQAEAIKVSGSDSGWSLLLKGWDEFRTNDLVTVADTALNVVPILQKWAELNIRLLRFSGEVRFGDELERVVYETKMPLLAEKMLKAVIYTHIDDQIFIQLFGSSSVTHRHTTGGTIKLIQKTDFPERNEIILKSECGDTRYLDVFIRIPQWAVNPTVTHGNVKYVARPGEYCQISRKWNDGDEFKIVLKN